MQHGMQHVEKCKKKKMYGKDICAMVCNAKMYGMYGTTCRTGIDNKSTELQKIYKR